jgi:hypothetical protein
VRSEVTSQTTVSLVVKEHRLVKCANPSKELGVFTSRLEQERDGNFLKKFANLLHKIHGVTSPEE